MNSNIVDSVIMIRDQFNAWLAQVSTPINIIYLLYGLYLAGVIIYMLDAAAAGRDAKNKWLAVMILIKFIIFHLCLCSCVLAVVFFFPQSAFTLFLKKIIDTYPLYPGLSIGLVVATAIVACFVGMLIDGVRQVFRRK